MLGWLFKKKAQKKPIEEDFPETLCHKQDIALNDKRRKIIELIKLDRTGLLHIMETSCVTNAICEKKIIVHDRVFRFSEYGRDVEEMVILGYLERLSEEAYELTLKGRCAL
jgi:hypothetical protein